jgi:hypothetical protein
MFRVFAEMNPVFAAGQADVADIPWLLVQLPLASIHVTELVIDHQDCAVVYPAAIVPAVSPSRRWVQNRIIRVLYEGTHDPFRRLLFGGVEFFGETSPPFSDLLVPPC